jgi:hypothetical protein
MADYTFTPRWNRLANGSVLVPERWVPALEQELQQYTFWPQFASQAWGGVQIISEGQGKIFNIRYIGDATPVTTALSSGTKVGVSDSTKIGNATGTLEEYGTAEAVETFTDWLSDVPAQEMAGIANARHAMQSRNSIIGNVFLNTTCEFTCDDATTVTEGSSIYDAGTDGTAVMLPYHVRTIVSSLRRKGITPFPDGYFRCIGRPGNFDGLKGQAEVYASAASLGINGLYSTGQVMTYNGVLFIEEAGQYALTAWNGTESYSCIFGANAVVGFDNFMRPDLIRYYLDDENDFGRRIKLGWLAYAGYCRPCDTTTNGRVWKIYHGV